MDIKGSIRKANLKEKKMEVANLKEKKMEVGARWWNYSEDEYKGSDCPDMSVEEFFEELDEYPEYTEVLLWEDDKKIGVRSMDLAEFIKWYENFKRE